LSTIKTNNYIFYSLQFSYKEYIKRLSIDDRQFFWSD